MITAFATKQEATTEAVAGVAEVHSGDLVAKPSFRPDGIATMGLRELAGIERTQTLLAFRAYPKRLLGQGFNIGSELG